VGTQRRGPGSGAGGTWAVALVVARDLRAAGEACTRAFPSAHLQAVASAAVPHLVVRVPLFRVDQWPEVRGSLGQLAATGEWQVLTVGPRTDWNRVEERRARAQELLPLVGRLPAPRRLFDLDDLVLFNMLATVDTARQLAFVQDVLGVVLEQPASGRLLATLDTLHWNDGSAKATARMLGVHVKTVHARLRRIEHLTGMRLDHPPDRLRMEVALYLLRATEGLNPSPPRRSG